MSLIGLLLVLAVIGLLAWGLTTFIPMPSNIKTLIIVICGIVALLYTLQAFGVLPGSGGDVRIPRLR